ncbi:MAG: hypothetical protein MI742_10250, partial [Desulfobacterales bacterium]|nr:hypothetical protein [Desulfobacterales bacterium]
MKRILTVFSLLTLLVLAGATSDVFAQTGFRILDIGEREYDNGPALSILFSEPLLRSFRHDDMVRVTVGDSLADGGWVLSQDARRLWFPHVEANTHYTVTVLESMESESGERLGHQVRRHVTTRKVEPAVAFASSGLVL